MQCTPSFLLLDLQLWNQPQYFFYAMQILQNYTIGSDKYDCGMRSAQCESALVYTIAFSDEYDDVIFWFDLFVIYVLTTLFTVLGVVGNVINIAIFSTNNIVNDSTKILLLATAVVELLHSLIHAILLAVCFLCFFDGGAAMSAFNIMLTQNYFNNIWLAQLSFDFVTILAVQRLVSVSFPYRASSIFSNRNTKIILIVLWALCVVTLFPLYFFYTPGWVFHPEFNKLISLGYTFHYDYDSTLEYVTQYSTSRLLLGLCILSVSIAITVFKLQLQGKRRFALRVRTKTDVTPSHLSNLKQMSIMETRVTKMSLAICIITCILYLTISIMIGLSHAVLKELFASPLSSFSLFAVKLLASANCSFNFFLYLRMSPKFRDAFTKLFCKRCH